MTIFKKIPLKNLAVIILFIIFSSCKDDIGDNIIYQDILGQLIVQNNILPLFSPPLPYFDNENDNQEINSLKKRVFYLENRLNQINDFLTMEHKVLILDKLLPVKSESFKIHYIGTSETLYDTTWIGNINKRIISGYHQTKIDKLNLKIPYYRTEFIGEIPEPDTSFYSRKKNTKIDRIYLQLSEIILNESGNKGIFYYAISTDGNLNGFMEFCYIEKIKNNWEIKNKN